jgi:hypothetical protein
VKRLLQLPHPPALDEAASRPALDANTENCFSQLSDPQAGHTGLFSALAELTSVSKT